MPDWERDDLVLNLVTLLSQAGDDIQERMLVHFSPLRREYAQRVAEGLERSVPQEAGAAV